MNARRSGGVLAVVVLAALVVAPVSADLTDDDDATARSETWDSTTPETGLVTAPDPGSPAPAPADPLALDLTEPVRGAEAVERLGDDIADLAAARGLSVEDMTAAFDDPTLGVTPDGTLFYAEESEGHEAHDEAAATATEPAVALAPVAPLDQTFTLHSKAGSSRTIYLDFDGHTVSGTQWNTQFGVPAQFHIGYSLDGDYATFNDEERRFVQEVWQHVAEDYAAFDVDVTTQDPGTAALVRSSQSDQAYGTRALVTNSPQFPAECGSGCAGIAFVGTANQTTERYHPAWIKGNVNSRTPASMALVISHEVGHTFGLGHAGATSSAYYGGHDNWGPIMGAPYGRAVTQWTDHSYTGATRSTNQASDDITTFASFGLSPRADEAPGSVTNAPGLTGPTVQGFISTRADADTYAIGSCEGRLVVEARSTWSGGNLDIGLELLASNGTTLTSANPTSGQTNAFPPVATGLDASLDVASTSGARWIRIDGVGRAGVYSDYASLGAYTVTVTCTGTGGPPSVTLDPGLVQAPGQAEIWLATGTSRHWIASFAEYEALQSRLGGVRPVAAATLNAVPLGQVATRVVKDARNGTVWVLQKDGSRHQMSAAAATNLAVDASVLPALGGPQVDAFTAGAAVGDFHVAEGDGRVFLVTPGERHHVVSWSALQQALSRRGQSYVVALPAGTAGSVPVTSSLLAPMTLVRSSDQNAVYLAVDELRLLHVPSFGLAYDAGATGYEVLAAGALASNGQVPGSLAPTLTCHGTTYAVSGGRLATVTGGTGGLTPLALAADACQFFPRSGSVAAPLFVQTPGRGEVYVVDQGVLHHVRSYAQLVQLNGNRALTLLSWSGETVARVGTGAPILASGSFVQFAGDPSVYQGDGRVLRHVTSFAALVRLGGGQVPPIEALPASWRPYYDLGSPIS
ncbi:zinc-dependent metalloprotease family protein [Aeromicrobium sp. Leaf350]|uniref:zinc-dependent metalloprotease family protein n=1 Tax=Aeromicrobium sp. Leaf350 TaxID=2876565 RepID=UPI001E493D93|nr:zinc-dependent metalloprotease family protein [Aeromicrobium sp. Leaf350]